MVRRRHLLPRLATGVALLAAGPLPARAQSGWPTRPVRLILPDAPGSGNDTTARLLAPLLGQALGQPFVVDNRGGAGGRIGVEAAFRAAPDGATFLFGNAGSNGINAAIYQDLPYDLTTAFDPVALLVLGPNALVVNPRLLPVGDVAGLIAAIRAHPGALNYASGGIGSSAHMTMELFRHQARLELVHVPYRGTPALAQAIIAGEAAIAFANLVNVMPYIQREEMRLLAVTTAERWPNLPRTPTMQESGLPGFETIAWNGILAPRGTPEPIRARLWDALHGLREDVELQARIELLGGRLAVSTPQEFQARIEGDIARWKRLAAVANIQAQ